MAEGGDRVVLIVNTASWERVYLGLSLASAVATLGEEVCVFFSFGGLFRLKKGFTDEVGEETSGWLREQIEAAVHQGGISKISDLIKSLRRLGGKVYACTAAMAVHNLIRTDLIDDIDEVQGMVEFYVSKAKEASTLIYL